MMLAASPTQYETLPSIPMVNALPGGVPQGPWGPLYRHAPGAQIPSVRYPALAGFGAVPGVTLVGSLGNGLTGNQKFVTLLLAAGLSAGTGAAFAMTLKSSRPVLYPSLLAGGMTLLGGLITMMVNGKNGNGAAATP